MSLTFLKAKLLELQSNIPNQIAELNQARRGTKIKIKKCSISNKGQSRKAALQIKMTFSKTNMTFYEIIKVNEIVFHPQGFLSGPKKWCCTFRYLPKIFGHFLGLFSQNSSLYVITSGNSSRKIQCI